MNYFEIILAVLDRWYKSFAQATPKLAVGILVFLFFLTMSSYLSKLSVKIFHRFFPKSKNNSIVTLIKVFKFLTRCAFRNIGKKIVHLIKKSYIYLTTNHLNT